MANKTATHTTDDFQPRPLGTYEEHAAGFLMAYEWKCETGELFAGYALAAINASIAVRKKLGFKTQAEWSKWVKDLPAGETFDFPLPSTQTHNAFVRCVDHIKSCKVCNKEYLAMKKTGVTTKAAQAKRNV